MRGVGEAEDGDRGAPCGGRDARRALAAHVPDPPGQVTDAANAPAYGAA